MRTPLLSESTRWDDLRALIRDPRPMISVYLRAASPAADARELDLRWKVLERRLTDRGASPTDLAAVAVEVAQLDPGDRVLAAIAADGQLRLSLRLEHCDEPDGAVLEPWPRVLPLLRWQQQRVPAVVAVLGHGLAEFSAYDRAGARVATETVVGSDDEIERNAPGGWAQSRYRRRAEDSWAHNAAEFAGRVAELADRVGAGLVVLAGDSREVQLVRDRLPSSVHATVETVHARPVGNDMQVPADQLRVMVAAVAARERRALVAQFDEAAAARLAVEGPDDVQRALDEGAVARLVVVHGRTAAQLADLMVVEALDTEADVLVVEPEELSLIGGLGAWLRY